MSENLANCGNTNDPSPTPFERNENILPNGFAFPNDINKATMKKYLKFDENPTKEIRILKPLTLEEETLSNISVQGSDNQEDEELSSSIFKSFDERNSNNYLGFRRISKLETKEQKNERMYKEFLRWKVFADVFEYNGKISLFESDKSELSLSEYYYDNYEEPLVIGDYQYKGFLYRLTIWQTAITQIPNQFDICSNGQSVTSCLWSCDSNNYYNEITDACENCDSSCTSGCSTFGTCNQCSSSFCQTCSDFNATCAESTSYNSCLG